MVRTATNNASVLVVLCGLLTPAICWSQAVAPPRFEAFDTPNDGGGSITVTWPAAAVPEGTSYQLYLAESPKGPFHLATSVAAGQSLQSEDPAAFGFGSETANHQFAHVTQYEVDGETVTLKNDSPYFVRLGVRTGVGETRGSVVEVVAEEQYFDWAKLNNLLLAVVLSVIILGSISMARRRDLFVRRIAGLEALDEALGRATEMGKSVLYVHGLRAMDQISTIAAVNILGRVARRTAEYDTLLKVTNSDPVVMSVSQETVKEAYIEAGRPDAFNPNHIFVAGTDQFSYAAAVEGIMVREKPAAHIMMGYFYAESLLLAETGSTTGAIQIAGTDAFTQLPFFVTTCDYTLMGEELYAASAYLSREPRLLGSLKGQDISKGLLLIVLVVGAALATAGFPQLTHLFTAL